MKKFKKIKKKLSESILSHENLAQHFYSLFNLSQIIIGYLYNVETKYLPKFYEISFVEFLFCFNFVYVQRPT